MTLEQIQALTDEEIRVRIAELTGDFKNCRIIKGQHGDLDDVVGIGLIIDGTWSDSEDYVPNYPADLNACHEFERMLIGPQAVSYGTRLAQLQRRDITIEPGDRYPKAATVHEWHATARQRCEAFIATMGK